MVAEMDRDCASIFSDQNIAVCFDPEQNIRVKCAYRRRTQIADDKHIDTLIQPSQLALDSVINMLVQKKARIHSVDSS